MIKREDIETRTEELILPFIKDNGLELIDIDFEKEGSDHYLRVYIDKPGGVTIDDCENVSRSFNEVLDREAYIDQPYIFEVSSPGLTRPLKKEKDFERSLGKKIDIRLYQKKDGLQEYSGILKDYDNSEVTVTIEDTGEEKTFDRKKISLIRLAYVEEKQ